MLCLVPALAGHLHRDVGKRVRRQPGGAHPFIVRHRSLRIPQRRRAQPGNRYECWHRLRPRRPRLPRRPGGPPDNGHGMGRLRCVPSCHLPLPRAANAHDPSCSRFIVHPPPGSIVWHARADGDGDLDLFVGSQTVFHALEKTGTIWEYHNVYNQFWVNNGNSARAPREK